MRLTIVFFPLLTYSVQNMGIIDEFHQKAILVCIDELCQRNGNSLSDVLDRFNLALAEGNEAATTPASHHQLREQSFSALQRCDRCNKYLRGIIHQGYLCQGALLEAYYDCIPSPCVHTRVNVFFTRRIVKRLSDEYSIFIAGFFS